MGSGKRASMREGPLANLFRKTETEASSRAGATAEEHAADRSCPSGRPPRRRSGCVTRSRARSPAT